MSRSPCRPPRRRDKDDRTQSPQSSQSFGENLLRGRCVFCGQRCGLERLEEQMRRIMLGLFGAICACAALTAQGVPQPTCRSCPGTYIPLDELQAYVKKAIAEKRTDQQVRDVDIGKSHVGIGIVHRGKLDAPAPNSVAEHDLVSEVYHIIDGAGTLVLGPDILDMKRRPATSETVRMFNGPGNNGSSVRDGKTYQLKAGDVVVIPAG